MNRVNLLSNSVIKQYLWHCENNKNKFLFFRKDKLIMLCIDGTYCFYCTINQLNKIKKIYKSLSTDISETISYKSTWYYIVKITENEFKKFEIDIASSYDLIIIDINGNLMWIIRDSNYYDRQTIDSKSSNSQQYEYYNELNDEIYENVEESHVENVDSEILNSIQFVSTCVNNSSGMGGHNEIFDDDDFVIINMNDADI